MTGVTRTIRAGINNGLTSQQIAQNLRSNVFKGSQAQAQALVSTGITAVSNKARMESFASNKDVLKGYQQVSTFDSRTSDICIAYAGMAWDFEGNPLNEQTTLPFNGGPPRHFNCRSTLVPVTKSFEELGLGTQKKIPEGTRASMDGQIPADTTFPQWLRTKPKSFQDKLLGPARAKLWRGNKITLNQLVDMRGNPLTVEQLRELARKKRKKTPTPAAAAPAAAPPPPEPTPEPVSTDPWEGVPEFKNVAEAEAWIKANLVTGKYGDQAVKIVKSWDKNGVRVTAAVTQMMERRFGLKKANYIGRRDQHPEFRFKNSKGALASVHMETDSLLLAKSGLDVKDTEKAIPRVGATLERRKESQRKLHKTLLEAAVIAEDVPLQRAIQKALDDDIFEWTAGDFGQGTGLQSIWRTMVHESGHRMHAQYFDEINAIHLKEFRTANHRRSDFKRNNPSKVDEVRRTSWWRQTSEYGATNDREFFAEQFVRYMLGETERVFPPYLEFFRKLDKGGSFGEPDLI